MSVEPKEITVFLDTSPAARDRAGHAVALAQRWGARVIGVHLVYAGVMVPPSLSYALGSAATRSAIAYEEELDAEAEAAAAALSEHFRSLCAQFGVDGEFRPIGRGQPVEDAVLSARHSDLVVIGHPADSNLPEVVSPERFLIAAGVPVLVIPSIWQGKTIGDRVVIGWNASREARRAVSDSMTFIVGAKLTTVLVINPASTPRHGEEPGADIALYLARHGARVTVDRVASSDGSVAETMLHYAADRAADLLVLGAYSHARWREILFGGTTRSLLAEIPVPLLISS